MIEDGNARVEWLGFDLEYGDVTVEVKASGLSQERNPHSRSTPRFGIAPHKLDMGPGDRHMETS